MTLTLPVLVAILAAVFLCPATVLLVVMRRWKADSDDFRAAMKEQAEWHRTERREFMDRLFARNWNEFKAFEVAETQSAPRPATDAEEYEAWAARNGIGAGLQSVGTIVDE